MNENNKKTEFRVIPGGPIEVSGEFSIRGIDGKILDVKSPAYLCRCGGSSSKPFCDGTHKTIGFNK